MTALDEAEVRCWLAKTGNAEAAIDEDVIERFRSAEAAAVDLEGYRWGQALRSADRMRLIAETRAALGADPGLPGSGQDIPDDISDSDLFLAWMRA